MLTFLNRFHQRDREWLIESANTLTILGLIALAVAMTGVVLLITDVLYDGVVVVVVPAAIAALIGFLWFLRPLRRSAGRGRAGS